MARRISTLKFTRDGNYAQISLWFENRDTAKMTTTEPKRKKTNTKPNSTSNGLEQIHFQSTFNRFDWFTMQSINHRTILTIEIMRTSYQLRWFNFQFHFVLHFVWAHFTLTHILLACLRSFQVWHLIRVRQCVSLCVLCLSIFLQFTPGYAWNRKH